MDLLECGLPGGYVDDDGKVYRNAVISPLTGFEERLIADRQDASTPLLVTRILSRCLRRVGPIAPVSEDMARSLLIGDRQYLLIKLRELTFGKKIHAVIACTWPDCSQRVDIDFLTDDIPVKESHQKGRFYRMTLKDGQEVGSVSFRLPNGEDQEILEAFVEEDEAAAGAMLIERCVQFHGCGPEEKNCLSAPARLEIEQEMSRLSPQVELTMQALCPECGRKFTTPFDLQEFCLGELRAGLNLLLREVHYLAFHYHWSEKEILGMTRKDRRRYIDVLSDEIGRLNHAVSR